MKKVINDDIFFTKTVSICKNLTVCQNINGCSNLEIGNRAGSLTDLTGQN